MSVTLSQEELQNLQSFQQNFANVTRQYGELVFQKKLVQQQLTGLEQALSDLESQMDLIESNRLQTMQDLQEKYGDGSIDLQTGTFTSVEGTPVESNLDT